MSIALQRNGKGSGAIRRPRFGHGGGGGDGPCLTIDEDNRRLDGDSDSCSSSSVGRNSDVSVDSSLGEFSGDEEEVQSSLKGPLETMDELAEVLPIKRGMSKFYSGKSKSFTSLADAESIPSVKAIAKPENPYNKKRKNLLSRANLYEKTRHRSLLNLGAEATLKRQPANFGRTTFLAGETSEETSSASTSPSGCLPPLHPHQKRSPPPPVLLPPQRQSPWRSFSLSDIQSLCASTSDFNGLAIATGAKNKNEIH